MSLQIIIFASVVIGYFGAKNSWKIIQGQTGNATLFVSDNYCTSSGWWFIKTIILLHKRAKCETVGESTPHRWICMCLCYVIASRSRPCRVHCAMLSGRWNLALAERSIAGERERGSDWEKERASERGNRDAGRSRGRGWELCRG